MIRMILLAVALLLFFIVTLPFLLLDYIIGLFSKKARKKMTHVMVMIWSRYTMFFAGEKVEVIGKEKVPTDRAVLFVGNHNSFFDITTFYGYAPVLAGFVAKKEIKKVPVLSWWMICIGCLFIDRSTPRAGLKTILEGIERIKAGESMFIFPEGTRSKTGELGHFKPGSLRLAEKSGCPIVPVAMVNTAMVFEGNGKRMHGACCKLVFGDPIYREDLPEEYQKNCAEFVKGKIQALLDANR